MIPQVAVTDASFLLLVLCLWELCPSPRVRLWLGWLAGYVAMELLGHYLMEDTLARVLVWTGL